MPFLFRAVRCKNFFSRAQLCSKRFLKTVSCPRRLHRPNRKDTVCDARVNIYVHLVKCTEKCPPATLHMPLACLRITVQCHLYLRVLCCSSYANVVYIESYGILELDVNVNANTNTLRLKLSCSINFGNTCTSLEYILNLVVIVVLKLFCYLKSLSHNGLLTFIPNIFDLPHIYIRHYGD